MKREIKSFDILLVILVCSIAIFGIIIIGSATHIKANGASSEYSSQQFWFLSGIVMMMIAAFVDYHIICKFYIAGYLLNLALLIALFFIGDETAGVSRWIRINGGIGIQPSEFSKLFIIVFLAKFLDVQKEKINDIPVLLFTLAAIGMPVVLIKMQPSLSASLVVLFVSVCILYISKLSYKYIIAALLLVIPIGIFTIIDIQREEPFLVSANILDKYMVKRILDLINPNGKDANMFQTMRSINVIGSGQFSGKGLYNGVVNKINYVPMAQTDFIFSVIGEEFGFLGSVACLCALLLVVFKCIIIAGKAPDLTGRLLAAGVASMIAFQTFVNVGVATGVLPNTGMPLPFVSYGGSSMWACMIGIGLCLNVGMFRLKSFFEG